MTTKEEAQDIYDEGMNRTTAWISHHRREISRLHKEQAVLHKNLVKAFRQ